MGFGWVAARRFFFFDRKYVINKKLNAKGNVEIYKSFLVTTGYSHMEGIDFVENFSHVAKLTSIRLILFIVVSFNLELEYMDV